MENTTHLKTCFTAAAFLLIGTLAVAQTAPATRSVKPREASSGQASGMAVNHQGAAPGNSDAAQPQATSRKHIAGVKYENRVVGNNTGGANTQQGTATEQSTQDSAQRKSGSIIVLDREGATAQRKDGSVVHSDFPRSADRNSAHATESLSPSNAAQKGVNPLYENGEKSGTNPLYESGKNKEVENHTNKATEFKQDFGPVQASKK